MIDGAVPDFAVFPSVDELTAEFGALAADNPDLATLRRIGTSRLGEPLWTLTVGDFAQHAVVFAGVHPNEPVGSLTALHLARRLLDDAELRERFDCTWHIVPCIDPDGARLNEGWFAGPFTRGHYATEFYRPAGVEQVEWTFPLQYKRVYFDQMMPETIALMRLIDDTKPAFMCSLHNGEYGGVYYYLSRPVPDLYADLHAIPAALGLPLDSGEPEAPFVDRYATAIYGMVGMEVAYEFLESVGLDPTEHTAGSSSSAYASERYGTLSLVTEVPYWTHQDANDETQSTDSYADVLAQRADGLQELGDTLTAVLAAVGPDWSVDSPFLRASRAFAPTMSGMATQERARAEQPDSRRPATVAERFSCADLVHCFRLRFGGMLLRALDGEVAIGNGTPRIREQQAMLRQLHRKWIDEAEAVTSPDVIPIGTLVAVQYNAILAAVPHATATRG